jgi:thiamine biosynthesis lipoprotein
MSTCAADSNTSSECGRATRAQSTIAMDTVVTAQVEAAGSDEAIDAALARALAWFGVVERVCSRFDSESELVQLCRRPGRAVPVSRLLFEAVGFAVAVAKLTHGAFDPTVGGAQQGRGISTNYVTGASITTATSHATYRDVVLDPGAGTITLRRPLLLDLGAVAKGLAIDLAARELAAYDRFAVEAGGDLFAGGTALLAVPWTVGVQHPCRDGLLGTLHIWNRAVCSSGGYERPTSDGEHHLLDPHTGHSPQQVIGVTAIAPTALVADALGTAAFILGPTRGLRLLHGQGIHGIIVSANAEVRLTPGNKEAFSWSSFEE